MLNVIKQNYRRGQITIEYFIIAAALSALTLVGLAPFIDKFRGAIEAFINDAAKRFASS